MAAVQLARLLGSATITALGRDSLGEQALSTQCWGQGFRWWRDPTRRATTYIDANGERSITVGKRLAPQLGCLPWDELSRGQRRHGHRCSRARLARAAVLSPRTGLGVLEESAHSSMP